MKLKPLISLLICIFFTSCATIISGTTTEVTITSKPTGAKVTLDNQIWGETPLLLTLDNAKARVIKLEKKGFKTAYRHISRKDNSWAIINIIPFLSPLGYIIDIVSDGAYYLEPDEFNVTLEPITKKTGKETHK